MKWNWIDCKENKGVDAKDLLLYLSADYDF